MKLKAHIYKIKCVNDLQLELPIDKGLYAITGQNGSGKSTIVSSVASVFFNFPMPEYFGKTDVDAFIDFEFGSAKRKWIIDNNRWKQETDGPRMDIKGFFEGSLIFGNRFKDMSYDKINYVDRINQAELHPADEFIRRHLGYILQGNENFYEKLWYVPPKYFSSNRRFKRELFFYEKNGKRVSQFHMSTGENLLISILNSLYIRNKDRASLSRPCLMLLDEIELALHPSSLNRLTKFLKEMARQYNYAIYFSTHSIELISGISPSNIFFIERHADDSIEVLNPCYPAYATRTLYDHSGYDKVILVEDDLAKAIIDKLLRMEKLLNNRLVHVLPCGGYTNVVSLADDVVKNNLLGKKASISIVLDGDIKEKVLDFISKKKISNNIPLNFLPIASLEKFLREKLYLSVDQKLFRELNDYIFQNKSLTQIIDEYKSDNQVANRDSDGKKLFNLIDSELRERKKDRSELIEMIVDYLFENENLSLKKLIDFLKKQMQ